jgi:hypothetical protein
MVKSHVETQTDRQIALLIGAITLGLLLRNVAADLLAGDAGEFQFAAWHLGLAHPTGYPLYLLVGGLWQHLWALLGVSPAHALNAFSAVSMAAAAALFFLLMVGWLPGTLPVRRLAAGLAVALLVANPTLRSQSLQAEVYTLHTLFMVAILLAARPLASAGPTVTLSPRHLVTLSFLLGLSLTHHATTLLLLPPLLLYLWLANRNWWRPARAWFWALPAFLLPLLLYLYIPLRSGPAASPWYHQALGTSTLTLYDNTWDALLNFVTGRSISVGFHDVAGAMAALPPALLLWLRHFEWPGLLLVGLGIFVLVRMRAWPLLALTAGYFAIQQLFNLFYAIGDIYVYYIPLYLVACIWCGFGAAGIGTMFRVAPEAAGGEDGAAVPMPAAPWAALVVVLLYWLPLQLWVRYTPLMEQIEAESRAVRSRWEEILAAKPPAGAILVSNDRNEIVPLFYLQAVEKRGLGYTGLFPLIAPDARFVDLEATVATALDAGGDQPVYLIKPMPGFETAFDLAPAMPPLVEVTGRAATAAPSVSVDQPYGPLRLLGYDWSPVPEGVQLDLQWQVTAPLAADYTTTVQLFDAAGAKVGQDDRKPGGDFYPTSQWKPGDRLVDRHTVPLAPDAAPVRLLIGMYAGPDAALLAPPLEVPLPTAIIDN